MIGVITMRTLAQLGIGWTHWLLHNSLPWSSVYTRQFPPARPSKNGSFLQLSRPSFQLKTYHCTDSPYLGTVRQVSQII